MLLLVLYLAVITVRLRTTLTTSVSKVGRVKRYTCLNENATLTPTSNDLLWKLTEHPQNIKPVRGSPSSNLARVIVHEGDYTCNYDIEMHILSFGAREFIMGHVSYMRPDDGLFKIPK